VRSSSIAGWGCVLKCIGSSGFRIYISCCFGIGRCGSSINFSNIDFGMRCVKRSMMSGGRGRQSSL
jgi:hypothetical protein